MGDYKTFSVEVPVRFSDLDAYGHVNNATFFTYLEDARIRILRGAFSPSMGEEPVFLVKTAFCDYKHPISMRESVTVTVDVRKVQRSSVELGYKVTDGTGLTYAEATTVLVSYDPKASRPTGVPDWFLEMIKA
ncbi:MAG: acyl-CoA thioesterase [Spirochaetales bacterium]